MCSHRTSLPAIRIAQRNSAGRRTRGLDVPAGGRAVGPAARGSGGRLAADDVAVPAQDGVRGDQQPQSLASRFWISR